ncbi:hypothetical protein Tco_1304563 [Tanacetum coccineum]
MCKQCFVTGNHDVCMLNYVNDMNSRADNQSANVSKLENQKKHKANVRKSKELGSQGSLASSRPSKPRNCLRWVPTGRIFAMCGKLTASSNTENKSDKSVCDNASTSNPSKTFKQRVFELHFYFGRVTSLYDSLEVDVVIMRTRWFFTVMGLEAMKKTCKGQRREKNGKPSFSTLSRNGSMHNLSVITKMILDMKSSHLGPQMNSILSVSLYRVVALRCIGERTTASAAAKPCQGYSFEFYLITGSLPDAKIKTMECLGEEYFQELLSRSFYQHVPDDESLFVMHNLMNDLATFVDGEFFSRLDINTQKNVRKEAFKKCRHMSFICEQYTTYNMFKVFERANSLRTFLAMPNVVRDVSWEPFYLSRKILGDTLP